MKLERKIQVLKFISLCGVTLISFPTSVSWLWGNLAVYVSSYKRSTCGSDYSSATAWTIPVHLTLFSVGPAISEFIIKRGGHRWAMLTSIFLYNASMALSSVTVKHSAVAMVITTGAMTGIASGTLYGQIVCIAAALKSSREGFFLALVISASVAGSILTNEFVTYYINPNNEPPNLTEGTESYFTQEDVIERVPSAFLAFSGVCFAWQIIIFLFICPFLNYLTQATISSTFVVKPKEECMNHETSLSFRDQYSETTSLLNGGKSENKVKWPGSSFNDFVSSDPYQTNSDDYKHLKRQSSIDDKITEGNVVVTETPRTQGHQMPDVILQSRLCNEDEPKDKESDASGSKLNIKRMEVTGIQMLKTPAFYIILFCYISADLSYLFVHNYYKVYGQQWIKDDHFITNYSTMTIISAVIISFVCGAIVDSVGVKYAFVMIHSALSVIGLFWYFTPMVNKWLYIVCTTAFRGLPLGFYIVLSSSILVVFGKTYYARNFSILLSMTVFFNLAAPLFLESILHNLGWFPLILSCSVINVIALCAVILVFPRL